MTTTYIEIDFSTVRNLPAKIQECIERTRDCQHPRAYRLHDALNRTSTVRVAQLVKALDLAVKGCDYKPTELVFDPVRRMLRDIRNGLVDACGEAEFIFGSSDATTDALERQLGNIRDLEIELRQAYEKAWVASGNATRVEGYINIREAGKGADRAAV